VEYDFIVAPGADPSVIELAFDAPVRVEGDVIVSAGGKTFRQHRPRVFQGAVEIEASYRLTERGTVVLEVGEFDPLISLRVDPVLDFSTYLGGPGEDTLGPMEMAADGNLLLAGGTQSPASPVLDPFQQPSVVSMAPILLKMSSDGRRVIFYTILGRNGWDEARGIAVAKDGTIMTGGNTRSGNFPLKNAFQSDIRAIFDNAFVTRLSADGRTLLYSSYLGGTNREQMNRLTLDDSGNAYFVGNTQSVDFPTVGAIQSRSGGSADCFVSKVSPEGKLLFSTYYGGVGLDGFWDVKWRSDDRTLIPTGEARSPDFPLKDPIQSTFHSRTAYANGALVMLSDDGSTVRYATLFGGSAPSYANRLALDGRGRIYLCGSVVGRGFPLRKSLFSESVDQEMGLLAVFDRTGREIQYATVIPGFGPTNIRLGEDDGIYLSGWARSSDFPVKDSFQPLRGGGVSGSDAALMKLSPDGSALLFATILGGGNGEWATGLVVAPNKVIYSSGQTISLDFPVKNAYQAVSGGSSDGFLYRITDDSVLPAAAAPFTVSPGQLTFRFVQGDTAPLTAPVTIGGLNGQVFSAVSVAWLRVTPSSLGVSGTLTVSVDAGGLAPGVHQGAVRLTPTSGEAMSIGVNLTVLAVAPTLSGVAPALVPVGTDDTEITLRGTGFTNRTTVQLQTVPWGLTPVRFVDSTTLRFTLPKPYFSAEYNHSITVQNPESAISKPVSLAVGRPAPAIAAKGIVSAASYAGDVISPGEMLTIFGENFEPGMRVNFDGLLATPLYVTPRQLSVVVPAGLAGAREANVIVEKDFDWRSVPVRMVVWPARPGLFTADSSGRGLAAALNEDGTVNSAANPAAKGAIVVLWGTGGGVESLPQKVFMDGMECEVLYAGGKDGLWQLNVRVPEFAVKGEVVWRAGERESGEGVFVALRD